MNRKLDIALVKSLRELLGSSEKRIAVYSKEGVYDLQFMMVYRNEDPPPQHKLRPDFSFIGFANLETGAIEMLVGAKQQRSITWTLAGRAVIGLVWLLLKVAYWSIVGLVLVIGMLTGVGHKR